MFFVFTASCVVKSNQNANELLMFAFTGCLCPCLCYVVQNLLCTATMDGETIAVFWQMNVCPFTVDGQPHADVHTHLKRASVHPLCAQLE